MRKQNGIDGERGRHLDERGISPVGLFKKEEKITSCCQKNKGLEGM
jgi:hypothetical protein